MTTKILSTSCSVMRSGKMIQTLKQKLTFILMLSLLTSGGFLQAQTESNGQIKGTIITNDGNASQGVIVKLIEINKSAVTNASGNYEFKKVPF